ncbi:hypothetical protein ACFQ7F_12395 [Streptomyces sp. NPDC056486]|uniref:hypothetical protein n=1 Tax=Streptomyces sp. NPDC056486 TaxID=3345835 RepID=UPI003697074A
MTPWLRLMTPWLRRLLILTVLLAVSPISLSYAADPSPGETRAGSVPGEGRVRPGRADPVPPPPPPPSVSEPPDKQADEQDVQADKLAADQADKQGDRRSGTSTTASDATRRTATGPAVPGLRVLPLGSGLVLIGLGVAFFAVRLRRG